MNSRRGAVWAAMAALVLVANGFLPSTSAQSAGRPSSAASTTPKGEPAAEVIGQLGGSSYVIAAQGGYAFLGAGPRLAALDISDPIHPVLLSETPWIPGSVPADAWTSPLHTDLPQVRSGEANAYVVDGEGALVVVRLHGGRPTEDFSLAHAGLTFRGEEEGDWAGYSVAPAGDVNNDGYDDILVGAPLAGEKNQAPIPKGPGKAYLILGRPRVEWPASHLSLTGADAVFLGCDVDAGMTGRQNYAAGDVNGDGYDDFLISGWKCGPDYHGLTFLYLGRQNVDWGYDYPVEQADASFLGEFPRDHSAYYVSTVGDVNGDGYDDFVTAAPRNDEMGEMSGQVYLILGRAEADWGLDYPLSEADASFLAEAADDRVGRSASGVGDVNGDGYEDFLIGAIFNDEPGVDAGQAYLILGRETADWGMDYSLSQADASFLAEAAGDEIGRRVSGAGDVNGDGYSDFLLGASRNDQAGFEAGKAYLFLGRPAADWGMDFPVSLADASFLGEAPEDQAGRRVSDAGDVNHDGYDDFLIGAPHNQRGGPEAGTAYLLYGSPTASWGHDFPLSQADVVYVGEAVLDRAGYDIAPAGDMDGDGTDDFLIGAWSASEAGEMAGQAYVLLSAAIPEPLHFTPDAPEGYVGEWHDFTTGFQDPNGWEDIDRIQMVLGQTLIDSQGLTVMYRAGENELYLRNATGPGWLGPCAPGEQTMLLNGVVQLDCFLSEVSNDGEQELHVTWRARWVLDVGEPRDLDAYLRAVDRQRNDSGFDAYGTWTLLPAKD